MNPWILIVIFVISSYLGYKIIKEIPTLLHTPLMSGSNAISGVTILGSLVSTALAVSQGSKVMGFIAIVFATINLLGGFLVTDRMLKMFNKNNGV